MMRTLLLLASAATLAFLTQEAEAQTRTERRVVVIQPDQIPDEAEVYHGSDDRALTERHYRGRWVEGEWSPDRRRFEGVYEVDERAGPPPRGPLRQPHVRPAADLDDRGWDDEEMMRRCNRRGSGVAGGVIGGIAGGVLGNRIAGRGDRRIGTAIGAAAGAVAGAAIERSADRRGCDDWYRDYQRRMSYGYGGGSYDGYENYGYGYGYGGAQTIVIPGAPIIVEETETTYETVTVAQPRPRVRHRAAPRRVVHRPRPRPRCVCR